MNERATSVCNSDKAGLERRMLSRGGAPHPAVPPDGWRATTFRGDRFTGGDGEWCAEDPYSIERRCGRFERSLALRHRPTLTRLNQSIDEQQTQFDWRTRV